MTREEKQRTILQMIWELRNHKVPLELIVDKILEIIEPLEIKQEENTEYPGKQIELIRGEEEEKRKREKFIRESAVKIFLTNPTRITAEFAVGQASALYEELKKKQKELKNGRQK